SDALLVNPQVLFYNRRIQLVTLAARYLMPTMYWTRELVEAGGLISYEQRRPSPLGRYLCGPHSQRREAGRVADPAADQVRAGDQPADGKAAETRSARNAPS